ncbi:CHAD domain-containing protein [Actinokineospora guangxiensis]|uniref:CHAD domain-containing protein n=1 Tax=Actinokineospora guangxiensis TaxID=1490288 RepID=A0ABW0ELN0_9PSEU
MGDLTTRVRARLADQAEALVHHVDGARGDGDPEHVHQVRVAVRRSRAILKTVSTHQHLQAELKWLGGVCGDVRDADVLLAHLRSSSADFADDERESVEVLLQGLEKQRHGARRHMLRALRSARYRGLLASLEEAAREAEPADSGRASGSAGPIGDVVDGPLRKFAKAVAKLGDDPPDDDLHALRIKGKRLRYAAEMIPGKKAKKLVKATKKFQDVLGDHQDAVVAEERVRALVDSVGDTDDTASVDVSLVDASLIDVAVVAGRLIERERVRKADRRARWRPAAAAVAEAASAL